MYDYSDLGLYFDELDREQQARIDLEMEADGALDGWDGRELVHPLDACYASGYSMGKLAKAHMLLNQLETATEDLLDSFGGEF